MAKQSCLLYYSSNRCDCQDIQDEKHVLFYCKDACVCALRQKYAFLFDGLFANLQAFASECRPYLNMFHRVSNQNVFDFLNQPNYKLLFFISELMDVFMLAGSVQQADEANDLAQADIRKQQKQLELTGTNCNTRDP